MKRRKGINPVNPQLVKLMNEPFVPWAVNLVDSNKSRFLRLSQSRGNLHVRRHQTIPAIHQEDDNICFLNGQLCLFAHLDKDLRSCRRFKSTRIDKEK